MEGNIEFIDTFKSYFFIIRRDFGFCNLFITTTRQEMHDMTTPYHIDRACFVVPAPKVSS